MATYSTRYFMRLSFGIGCKVALVMLAVACALSNARAAGLEPADSVEISASIFSPLGESTFQAKRNGETYKFGALVDISAGAPNIKGDLYFGLLSPDAKKSYTWDRRNGYALRQGMFPLVEDVDLSAPRTISTTEIVGRDLEYSLTNSIPPGLYFVFALLVVGDAAPADTRNWVEIGITPIFVE
jgi:hypothetical protein